MGTANVLEAFKAARERSILTVGLTGGTGRQFPALCDHVIIVPSSETQKIQEAHMIIGHVICAMVEADIHGDKGAASAVATPISG